MTSNNNPNDKSPNEPQSKDVQVWRRHTHRQIPIDVKKKIIGRISGKNLQVMNREFFCHYQENGDDWKRALSSEEHPWLCLPNHCWPPCWHWLRQHLVKTGPPVSRPQWHHNKQTRSSNQTKIRPLQYFLQQHTRLYWIGPGRWTMQQVRHLPQAQAKLKPYTA